MATYPAMHNFYRPVNLPMDQYSQSYGEDDEGSIVDENVLDHRGMDSGLEMSPPMAGSRRDSFAVSSTYFSPKTDDWHRAEMRPLPSNNPFVEHNSNNPFMRVDSAQSSTYGQQGHAWSLGNGSGMSTPIPAGHDGLPADFDISASVFQRPVQEHTPFCNPGYQSNSLFSSTNNSSPASPQERWSVGDAFDHRPMPRRMRPHSPTLRSHGVLSRRDGIRKKNARFEIPPERTLTNIDQLIAGSSDDQEIRELKQQKRLLRNRQAALDSRQRKKQHTERLEDEKKHYKALMNDIEEELTETKIALEQWAQKEQQWEQYSINMRLEKEEMVRAHTIETGDLRKKVSVLTEHVRKMESIAMSTQTSSTGYTADYSDIDSLTMDGAWDSISFINDFPLENQIKIENSLVPMKKIDNAMIIDAEKPAAQGLLLMLLLVGAFVASKGTSPAIPKLSDDVRAASATLLQDVFNDAGVQHGSCAVPEAVAPLPSSNAWQTPMMNTGLGVSATQTLGEFADSLSQPTQAQTNEQLFSLTPAQYNGITSQDFLQNPPPPSTSAGRRNLSESLAAMRADSRKSAAEVYTRSLLWDQVPTEVVRNFAKLVSECNKNTQDTGPTAAV